MTANNCSRKVLKLGAHGQCGFQEDQSLTPPQKKNHMHNFVYGVKSAIKKITVN